MATLRIRNPFQASFESLEQGRRARGEIEAPAEAPPVPPVRNLIPETVYRRAQNLGGGFWEADEIHIPRVSAEEIRETVTARMDRLSQAQQYATRYSTSLNNASSISSAHLFRGVDYSHRLEMPAVGRLEKDLGVKVDFWDTLSYDEIIAAVVNAVLYDVRNATGVDVSLKV